MFEFQPYIWEIGITAHLLCAPRGKSPQTAAIKLRSHKRRALLWYISKPSWQQAGAHRGKNTGLWKSNCLQDMINVRKAVHKAHPDLSHRTEVWSTLVQGLTPPHPQAPELLSGKEYESWAPTISLLSSLYPSLPSSAKQPKPWGSILSTFYLHTLSRDWILKKTERKIQPLAEACPWDTSPHFFMKSTRVHLPQLLLFRAISIEVPPPDAGILWKQALIALPFSLQPVFAFRLCVTSECRRGKADIDTPQVSSQNKTILLFGSLAMPFWSKKTILLVAWSRFSVILNRQWPVDFLGLSVIYPTQMSCQPPKPLVCILCTLFPNKVRYQDCENSQ